MISRALAFLFCLISITAQADSNIPGMGPLMPMVITGCLGSTFFVAASGNDANCGNNIARPWQTISKVNSASLPTNSTVSFNGGDTFSGGVVVASENLTINSYGTGQGTISSGNSTACVTAVNHGGLTVNNIICTGGGNATNTTPGITISNTTASTNFAAPTLTNLTVSGYGGSCIEVWGSSTSTAQFTGTTTVSNNSLHDCTGNSGNAPSIGLGVGAGFTAGIILANSHAQPRDSMFNTVHINNNTVFNTKGSTGVTSAGGFGIWLSDLDTACSISNNVVHDTGLNNGATASGPTALILQNALGCTIQFNELYHNSGGGAADGEGLDVGSGSKNTLVQYNYVHDNTQADILIDAPNCGNVNTTFRFNIMQTSSNNEAGIDFISGSGTACGLGYTAGLTGTAVYNNTFLTAVGVNTSSSGCVQGSGGGAVNTFQVNFSNNICIGQNGSNADIHLNLAAPNNFVLTGNDYFSDTGVFPRVTVNNGSSFMTSLSALHTAGYEQISGPTNVGTVGNPTLNGPFNAGTCGGYNGTCPTAYDLSSGTTAGKGNGLDLVSIYSFSSVGSQDFYGNSITSPTLPIGAAGNLVKTISGTPGLGDQVSSAAAFYSCTRGYNTAYATGSNKACNVRRGSDNHTCDLFIGTDGNLGNTTGCSTGGDNGQSAASFCNATTCFITEAYDQTGNGHHVLQATAGNQPPLKFNCTPNGQPCMDFTTSTTTELDVGTGTNYANTAQPYSMATEVTNNVNPGAGTSANPYTTDSFQFAQESFVNGPDARLYAGNATAGVATSLNTWYAFTGVFNSSSSIIVLNGTATTGLNAGTFNAGGNGAGVGNANGGASSLQGYIGEVGMWFTGFNATQYGNICHNQRLYFGSGGSC